MKFRFKIQQYQSDAVNAIADVFKGQPYVERTKYTMDMGIRQQSAGKDIARVGERLVIGPFENRAEAASLVEFVQVMGYGQVTLDAIKKN